MSVEIPGGFREMLTEFAVEVLRHQPRDLLEFSVQYFNKLTEITEETTQQEEEDDEDDEEDEDEPVAAVTNIYTRRASVCSEPYDPDQDEENMTPGIKHPKTDEQRQHLQEACNNILLFKNMDQEQMDQVLDTMFEKVVKKGQHIINQGEDGDTFYVIERGSFNILMKVDGKETVVGTYKNYGSFGELALMYNTPRAATIIATTAGALWCLNRITFQRIIVQNNAKKRKLYKAFIESLPLLSSLEPAERMKLVDVLASKSYSNGEKIFAQGDVADCFYMIESGQVRITVSIGGSEADVSICSRGQYFGELALLTNKPRAASAYAVGNVKCLVMDVQAFERLLGPCIKIMKRNISNYETQLIELFDKITVVPTSTE